MQLTPEKYYLLTDAHSAILDLTNAPPMGGDFTAEAASFAADFQEKNSRLDITAVCGIEKNTEQQG